MEKLVHIVTVSKNGEMHEFKVGDECVVGRWGSGDYFHGEPAIITKIERTDGWFRIQVQGNKTKHKVWCRPDGFVRTQRFGPGCCVRFKWEQTRLISSILYPFK